MLTCLLFSRKFAGVIIGLTLAKARKHPPKSPRPVTATAWTPAFDAWTRRDWQICAGLVVLVAAVFAQTLRFSNISLDDGLYGASNPVMLLGLSSASIEWAFAALANYWQPVAYLSHLLDFQIYGTQLWGHHLTNLLLHVCNAALLFLLLRRLTGAVWKSALVALFFAIDPLRAEPVAWIAARKDLLSTFFLFLAISAYTHYLKKPSALRYLLIVAAFTLGLMTKPVLVVAPLALLLLDFWPLRRLTRASALGCVVEKIPLLALSAFFTLLSLYANSLAAQARGSDASHVLQALPGLSSVAQIGWYLQKFFWPNPLSVAYTEPEGAPYYVAAALGLAFLAGFGYLIVKRWSRLPYLAVGSLWFLLFLSPTLGMGLADRFLYVPLIGLLVIAVWGMADLASRMPRLRIPALAAAALAAAGMAYATVDRLPAWRNSIILFNEALTIEDSARVHCWLGSAYALQNEPREAAREFGRAIELYPGYFDAHIEATKVLLKLNNPDMATEYARQAAELRPGNPEAHKIYADALMQAGSIKAALAEYKITLKLAPSENPAAIVARIEASAPPI